MKTKHAIILLALVISACKTEPQTQIQTTTLLETTTSWNGNQLPKFPEGQPKITISMVTIPPGAKLPKHIHPVYTTGVLTKGELTITDADNNQTVMKAGDVLVEVVNTVHYGENTGNEPAEIMVFYIGEEGSATSILAEKD